MRVVTNTDIIESRSTWAKRISIGGMLALLTGFIINLMGYNQPQLTNVALVLLIVGMFSAMISSYLVNSWIREPRADQFLSSVLKRFSNDYVLFNYTVSTMNILLTPHRLYVIIVKNQDGNVLVNGDRFKQKLGWRVLLKLFAADGIGSPVAEAQKGGDKLRQLLTKHLAESDIPDIQPLIVFSNKEVHLTINEPPSVPTLHDREIRQYLKEQDTGDTIPTDQQKQLIDLIGGQYSQINKGAKIKNGL